MSLVSVGDVCTALPDFIENMAAAVVYKRAKVGAVEALINPYNSGMAPRVDQGNGKRRAVDVFYLNRPTPSDVVTTEPADCVTTNKFGYKTQNFDIDMYVAHEFEVSEEYIAEICEGTQAHMAKLLQNEFDALVQKVDAAVINSLWSAAGTNVFSGNSNQITLDIWDDTNGKINAAPWETFQDQVANYNQFNNAPIIIGGGASFKVNQIAKVGCCNDGGVDIGQLIASTGWAFFNDNLIGATLGNANDVIVLEPGSAKFVPWLKYQSLAGGVLGNDGALAAVEMADGTMRGIVRDPKTGLPFNMKIIPDTCADKFYVRLELYFDTYTLPTDMFSASDSFSGYNGILKYRFT